MLQSQSDIGFGIIHIPGSTNRPILPNDVYCRFTYRTHTLVIKNDGSAFLDVPSGHPITVAEEGLSKTFGALTRIDSAKSDLMDTDIAAAFAKLPAVVEHHHRASDTRDEDAKIPDLARALLEGVSVWEGFTRTDRIRVGIRLTDRGHDKLTAAISHGDKR